MEPTYSRAPVRRRGAFLGGLALAVLLAPPAGAADPDKLDTSLKIIPADAAFYGSSLRIKEQFDACAQSRAWARVWAMPAVQQAWKKVQDEYAPGGQLAPVQAFFSEEENKELLAVLADAGSHEIFGYGGESWGGFLELFLKVYTAVRFEPLKAMLIGNPGGRSEEELQAHAALQVLAKNPDLIKVPDVVTGARVTDVKRVEKQLKRLETLLETASARVPELKGRVKRVKVNDGSFLTFTFDGSMVPWNQLPIKDLEDRPGEFAPLLRKLRALTLTVSIGVQHDYLMLSVGGTTEQLAKIGGAGPKLEARPELKPLAKFAGRKVTAVNYVSKDLFARLAGYSGDLDALVDLAKTALPKSDLPEEQQKRILKDLADLAKEMKAGTPEPGAMVDISFMTERGYEGYSYDYGQNPHADGSKPLTLLNHLGGDPILAFVGRSKGTGQGYAMFVKWVKVVYGHLDEVARSHLAGDDKEQYVKVTEKLLPLFKKLDETTAKEFLPSLADGQGGFVLDAKWSSKQWLKSLPATDRAMPMLEIGVVLGVSDAEKLRKAMTAYRETLNDIIGAVRALSDKAGGIGDFRVPPPESVKRGAVTLYFYPIPEEAGLDRRVVPTAGLSEKVAAMALSHAHAERLLKATPLKVDGGPLADPKKPLAAAVYVNWPALIDALAPWAEFGAKAIMEEHDVPEKERPAILEQVQTVLEVLKVFRTTTAATYVEDGVTVTHRETVVKDLAK
jgi:hypothetical protein